MRGIEIALFTWLKEPRTLLSVLHFALVGLPFCHVSRASWWGGKQQQWTAGDLSWAQLAELLCVTAHSPWQAAQGARVGRTLRLQHTAEGAGSWALSELSPVSVLGSGRCGQGCSPAGPLGLTPSLSGKWSSDLIFSSLNCSDKFDSQNDLLTQPAWEGISRTIQACSYAVGYSLVISLLPIPFHSGAVNHKWDTC